MEFIGQSEFLRALGSSLFNSLWQFGLFWIVFSLFIVPVRNLTPAVKHGILILFLSLASGWFLIDLLANYNRVGEAGEDFYIATLARQGIFSWLNSVNSLLQPKLALFSVAYLVVVLILFTNFLRYFFYTTRVQTTELQKLGIDLRLQVKRLASTLGIKKRVDIFLSSLIDTPMIIGFLKPTILLPLASINQLSVSQLEAILLHELAHIRRNDYLVNIYISTVKIVFFFNPFCRMLVESVRQEREKSCDDWVLQFRFDAHQYASALFQLETARSGAYSLGIAAGGQNKHFLLERIERILKVSPGKRRHRSSLPGYPVAILFIAFLTALTTPAAIKKTPAAKNFYVYSPATRQYETQLLTPSLAELAAHNNEVRSEISLAPLNNLKDEAVPVLADNDLMGTEAIAVDYSPTTGPVVEVSNLVAELPQETRDFSINNPEAPEKPVADVERPAPFVPNSSFSFQVVEDTSRPKQKEETYAERSAKESLVKAKKALSQVDWTRIQKELQKKGTVSKTALLKQLELSLEKLDWNEINKEVKESINQQTIDRWRASLKAELDDANKYKALQEEYQQLKAQLQLHQKLLKKDVELEAIQVEKEIKKVKVTVHL